VCSSQFHSCPTVTSTPIILLYMDILSWKFILKFVYVFDLVSDLLQLENPLADQYASCYICCIFITRVITPNTLNNFFRFCFYKYKQYWNIWHPKITYPYYVLCTAYVITVCFYMYFVDRASRNNRVKKTQLDAELILSILLQPLHVSGVSTPIIRMQTPVETWWHVVTHGRGSEGEIIEWIR